MTKIFLFVEFVVNFDSIIIDFSSQQYHKCFECIIQFSSLSRVLIHAQKNCNKAITCIYCKKQFTLNNKLYKHIRLHKKYLLKR